MRAEVGEAILRLAREDERLVFIGSDQGVGSMASFGKAFPSRFFMEGISEQYIVGMAAGLAASGLIPFVQSIAAFLTRRAFEQIYIDVGLQNLPVRLIGSSAGLTHSVLGPTHLAIDDIALMRTVPNMTVVAPKDGAEAAYWLGTLKDHPGPVYMRLVNDIACEAAAPTRHEPMVMLADSGPLLIVSTGAVTHGVLNALPSLAALALPARVLHVPLVHPFDVDACARLAAQAETIIVVEEHA